VQYDVIVNNDIEFTLTELGAFKLLDGQIHAGHLGSALGTHRNIPATGMLPNLNASSGTNSPYFSTLPDITLNVTGVADTGDAHTVTITAPSDLTSLTVRNHLGYSKAPTSEAGGTYTYSLYDNVSGETYTYYAERAGFVTKVGSFTVTTSDSTSAETNKADISTGWEAITRAVRSR
jgi:hypothetical protein